MNNLGLAYKDGRQLDKALLLFNRALTGAKEEFGPDHPLTLQFMNNLANTYQEVGRLDKALSLFEEAVMKAKEKLGPDHPLTLSNMNDLASTYQKGGDLTKAERILRESLTIPPEETARRLGDVLDAIPARRVPGRTEKRR